MEAEAGVMHFEDRNRATSQGIEPLEAGRHKEADSPLESPGGIQP